MMKDLERVNEELKSRSTRLNDENARLRDDVKTSATELHDTQGRLHESMAKVAETQEHTLPLEYAVARAQREKDLLVDQSKWLETELASKAAEVLAVRRECSQRVSELESKVSDLQSHADSNTSLVQQLQVLFDSAVESP